MLNYELAKELKDAGFPQGISSVSFEHFNEQGERVGYAGGIFPAEGTGTKIPTLSELIEACGDRFKRLALHNKNYLDKDHPWSAHWRVNRKGNLEVVWGSTPEEAVARLWLALNKK